MKRTLIFYLLILSFVLVKGQDTIIMKTGEKILGKITDIKGGLVFFENHNERGYSSSSIHEEDLIRIIYGGTPNYNQIITKPSKEVLKGKDYYAPWHEKINDTLNGYVSEIGIYLSGAIGTGSSHNLPDTPNLLRFGALGNLSIAYKSHMFTITAGACGFLSEMKEGEPYLNTNHIGILYGECIRLRHLLFSVSAGIAISNVKYTSNYQNSSFSTMYPSPYSVEFNQLCVSFPIEYKLLGLTHNGVGFGLHMSYNLNTYSQYSMFYFGYSIAFGAWNKVRNKSLFKGYLHEKNTSGSVMDY